MSVRGDEACFVCVEMKCVVCVSPTACFVDSELPLDSEGAELLADVFDVLSLKEIKLTAISGASPNDDAPDDEMAAAKAVLQKKLVSQVAFLIHTHTHSSLTNERAQSKPA